MSSAAVSRETEAKNTGASSDIALLFELENVAVDGRRVLYDTLRKVVSEGGGKLTEVLFMRHCTYTNPESFADALVDAAGADKLTAANLAEAVREKLAEALGKQHDLHPGLAKLITAARSAGMAIGAVTTLPEDKAQDMAQRLGLSSHDVKIVSSKDAEKHFPRADLWLKLAKAVGKTPRACIVAANSQAGCKSALSASMRCVAVPSALNTHEDYSGADLVLDSWDEMSAKDILEAVTPVK